MKLFNIFEELINNDINFTYHEEDDGDRTVIIGYINGKEIGSIVITFEFDAYWQFEDEMDEDSYLEIFPNDSFAKIETLEILDEYKGLGYAKHLMTEAIAYIKNKGEKVIYLNASPMGFKGLNIDNLVNFYKTFGFKTIVDKYRNNKEMVKYL